MASSEEQKRFVEALMPYAKQMELRTGIPAETTIAMAANETGWNLSNPVLFGIKGKGPKGKSDSFATWEVEGGQKVDMNDEFATYEGPGEAFGHLESEMTSDRYAAAPKKDPRQFAAHIQAQGWATDPNYADKISAIARNVGEIQPRTSPGGSYLEDPEVRALFEAAEYARGVPDWRNAVLGGAQAGG
jgi:flagellar protein FlgJ